MKELRVEAEEAHRLKEHDFVSHFRSVATMLAHGAAELRGVVALRIIEFEVLTKPLPHIPVGAFAADIAKLAHGIDGGSEVAEMGRMLLHELEMVKQMVLHLFGHIGCPKTDFFLRQKALS